jgi:hypothetical protein
MTKGLIKDIHGISRKSVALNINGENIDIYSSKGELKFILNGDISDLNTIAKKCEKKFENEYIYYYLSGTDQTVKINLNSFKNYKELYNYMRNKDVFFHPNDVRGLLISTLYHNLLSYTEALNAFYEIISQDLNKHAVIAYLHLDKNSFKTNIFKLRYIANAKSIHEFILNFIQTGLESSSSKEILNNWFEKYFSIKDCAVSLIELGYIAYNGFVFAPQGLEV